MSYEKWLFPDSYIFKRAIKLFISSLILVEIFIVIYDLLGNLRVNTIEQLSNTTLKVNAFKTLIACLKDQDKILRRKFWKL